jgi:hypothetical protein
VTSRTQRKPKISVIAAPIATAGHEMIRPTRMQAVPALVRLHQRTSRFPLT